MKVKIGKYKKNSKRKTKIQIDYWDCWSLDATLAMVIHPALVRFRNDPNLMHGYPYDPDTVPDFETYQKLLDKMIESFRVVAEDDWQMDDIESYKTQYEKVQEGFELFGKYYLSLWD